MIKDIIMAFTIFAGSIFGYGFFMFWLNWFDKNYEIRRRNDKMIENIINDILNNMTEEEKEDLFIMCLNNRKICKHLYKCSNKDKKYDKKNNRDVE